MKILVFTEGTILIHESAKDLAREQRVQQSKERVRPLPDQFFAGEIPNGNAVQKLQTWKDQGAEIFYLTSRTEPEQVAHIKCVLEKHDFPDNHNLLFRERGKQYKDVAEKLIPNILIEDDCESIGGEEEMTYTHIKPELKKRIKSVVVPEFGGIGHLPDSLEELASY